MTLKERLKSGKPLLLDGAMGTYYSLKHEQKTPIIDLITLTDPEGIKEIYIEYLSAGAQIINTNTFSSNTYKLQLSRPSLEDLLHKAFTLAQEAAQEFDAQVAADIGPLPQMQGNDEVTRSQALEEFYFIIDCFLKDGCDIFNFETFTSPLYIEDLSRYIKNKNPDAYVMASFVLNSAGHTLGNYSAQSIIDRLHNNTDIDCLGFNCGTGPTHLYHTLKKIHLPEKTWSVVPNASYPEVIDNQIIYSQNPEYFAEIMLDIHALGVQILGGCCGTTPDHIHLLKKALENPTLPKPTLKNKQPTPVKLHKIPQNIFREKIEGREFVIAVELPPPRDAKVSRVLKMAKRMKEVGADIITFSDSPLGRARTNPIALSAKTKRDIGICALPHLCCRDRNTIALKSDLLGAYIEELSNILLITGDPIPQAARSEVSSIFNLNSFKLIELVHTMNQTVFAPSPFHIGAALNLNVANKQKALARMQRKKEAGADFFMTQPIYEDSVIDFLTSQSPSKDSVILAGIMPIVNYSNARFLNNEIPGIHLPKEVMRRFHKDQTREEAQQIGTELALKTIQSLLGAVQGVYLVTPLERIDMIEDIIRGIKKMLPLA